MKTKDLNYLENPWELRKKIRDLDVLHFSRLPYWTLEETVMLSLAKDIASVSIEVLEDRKKTIEQLFFSVLLSDKVEPFPFIRWGLKLDMEFPAGLVEKILKFHDGAVEWIMFKSIK